jgi:hypothetical protein
MATQNKNTGVESLPPQKPGPLRAPKIEIDFESLIAAGIAAVVIKPAKKRRRPWSNPRS